MRGGWEGAQGHVRYSLGNLIFPLSVKLHPEVIAFKSQRVPRGSIHEPLSHSKSGFYESYSHSQSPSPQDPSSTASPSSLPYSLQPLPTDPLARLGSSEVQ